MFEIYEIDFNDRGNDAMPPNKRKPRILSLLYAFLWPLQYLRDLFFNTYVKGQYSAEWGPIPTYTKDQVVMFVDYQLYIAIQNVPIMTPCIDTNFWVLVSDNVGLRQRANTTGQKLSLEYVLNKHYGTTFRQPAIGTSDIYVVNNHIDTNYFVAGIDGGESSFAAISGEDAKEFVGTGYTYESESLVIFVPNATLDAISQSSESAPYLLAQKIVLFYANRFIFAGIIARVEGY